MDLLDPEQHFPWVTYEARKWLDGYLRKDMTVFEWGTGGSTLYYAKRVHRVWAVEHDATWAETVRAALKQTALNNCDYFLIPPRDSMLARFLPYGPHTYVSRTFAAHHHYSFKEYVRKIDAYADQSFDLVVVDGRARAACMQRAIRTIKKGGFLMLDNSERELYQPAINRLFRFDRMDFFGKGPRCEESWQTTLWRIR